MDSNWYFGNTNSESQIGLGNAGGLNTDIDQDLGLIGYHDKLEVKAFNLYYF